MALHRVHRLGSVRFAILERAFPSLADAWSASRGELTAAGLDERSAAALVQARAECDPHGELKRLERASIRPFARGAPEYPARLREIHDSPPVLYVRGARTGDDEWSVAVVGTRRATAYGRQAAGEFARGLAANLDALDQRLPGPGENYVLVWRMSYLNVYDDPYDDTGDYISSVPASPDRRST